MGCGPVYNILMKKVQALIGGRVTFMGTGSAPLSPAIQKFVQSVFNCPVRQGYGCTEVRPGDESGDAEGRHGGTASGWRARTHTHARTHTRAHKHNRSCRAKGCFWDGIFRSCFGR